MIAATLEERLKEICEAVTLAEHLGYTIKHIIVREGTTQFDPEALVSDLRIAFPAYEVAKDKIANNWIVRAWSDDPFLTTLITPNDMPRLRANAALEEVKDEPQPQTPIDTSVLEGNPMFGMF